MHQCRAIKATAPERTWPAQAAAIHTRTDTEQCDRRDPYCACRATSPSVEAQGLLNVPSMSAIAGDVHRSAAARVHHHARRC